MRSGPVPSGGTVKAETNNVEPCSSSERGDDSGIDDVNCHTDIDTLVQFQAKRANPRTSDGAKHHHKAIIVITGAITPNRAEARAPGQMLAPGGKRRMDGGIQKRPTCIQIAR